VWRAVGGLGNHRLVDLLWPEGLPTLLIGGVGSVLILRATPLSARIAAMGDVLALAAALLAVVFAALALVVSIPSSRYIQALSEAKDGGIQVFLDPFLVAVGTQVTIVLAALGYLLAASSVPRLVEHLVFYAIGFIFVFGLLDVAALARSLVRHGINRSIMAAAEEPEDETSGGDVHHLARRRDNNPSA
jgi:hypothetical protein